MSELMNKSEYENELKFIEAELIELDRIKFRRVAFIVIGVVFSSVWLYRYISAGIETSSNPASVQYLASIFMTPFLLAGGLFLIVGAAGFFICTNRITKLEKKAQLLRETPGADTRPPNH